LTKPAGSTAYVSAPIDGPLGSGSTVTFSFFAKAGSTRFIAIQSAADFPSRADAVFDLDSGHVISDQMLDSSVVSARMIRLENGWWRCVLTTKTVSSSFRAAYIAPAETNFSWIDSNSSAAIDVLIWGAQIDLGDTPTGYL
ncbi:phage head spike fiber domain-containing protein, partial [Staphylococcus aureus]